MLILMTHPQPSNDDLQIGESREFWRPARLMKSAWATCSGAGSLGVRPLIAASVGVSFTGATVTTKLRVTTLFSDWPSFTVTVMVEVPDPLATGVNASVPLAAGQWSSTGAPEAVRDGVEGVLVSEGDLKGMSDAIVRLAGSAGMRRDYGIAGWQRAREMFRWEQEREALLSLMELA